MATPADRPFRSEGAAGLTVTFGPFEVSLSRLSVAHSLIWSTSELHARATPVDGGADIPPLASGPWVAALIAGWYAQSAAIGSLRAAGVEVGSLVSTDVRYQGPVYGADLIYCESTVRSCVPASSAGPARIVIEDRAFKAADQPVLTALRIYEWASPSPGAHR